MFWLFSVKITTKNLYIYIKYERPTALYRWEEMYYYADFDWPVLFNISYKVARETDVQSLQFKIINTYIGESLFMGQRIIW